jgi:hypothetical protein
MKMMGRGWGCAASLYTVNNEVYGSQSVVNGTLRLLRVNVSVY